MQGEASAPATGPDPTPNGNQPLHPKAHTRTHQHPTSPLAGISPLFSSFLNAGNDMASAVTPFGFLFLSSVPLLTGAFVGYKRAMAPSNTGPLKFSARALAEEAIKGSIMSDGGGGSGNTARSPPSSPAKSVIQEQKPAMLAIRALSVGTLLSVGGFCALSAGVFYLTGSKSVQDLISICQDWAPQKRKQLERVLSFNESMFSSSSDKNRERCDSVDVDVKAVQGMSAEEELEYYKRKYIPDLYEDEKTPVRPSRR